MKKQKPIRYVTIALIIISVCFSLCACKDKGKTIDKPYICYYPLDWGMTVEECVKALDIEMSDLRSAVATSPCGLPSTAYMGLARIFDYESDITLWFTAYEEGQPEGLSSIIIANAFRSGREVTDKFQKIFDMYKTPVTKDISTDEHDKTSIPFASVAVVWKTTPFDEQDDKAFVESWNALLTEKSQRSDVTNSLTEVTLKYLQEEGKYRIDIRGEPAAYYNYLNSKSSK